jgi:RNA polymerase sigma-70 factor (ECF subfamily)
MGADGEPLDGQLVLLAKDGSLDAFNSLVDRYQGAVYSLCYRLLGQREPAEDASQEAFLSAYRAIGRFEGGNFRSWLLRIAANECKDELRRRNRKDPRISLDDGGEDGDEAVEVADRGPGAETLMERAELGRALERLLREITFEQRQAIVLVDVYDFQYNEVAVLTATSVGTIKSRIHRGRERLRRLLAERRELFGDVVRPGR